MFAVGVFFSLVDFVEEKFFFFTLHLCKFDVCRQLYSDIAILHDFECTLHGTELQWAKL
jgi:hypothetical protein